MFQNQPGNVYTTVFLLSNFDRQHLPLCPPHQYCWLRTQFVFHFGCFCVDVKHKSQEILRNTIYTCMFLKVLLHCVVWQCDNLNQPGTMLKSWDIVCNTTFQLSISFCGVQCQKCGTHVTRNKIVRHKKRSSAGTLYCTQCPNFSTLSHEDLNYHLAKKHGVARPSKTYICTKERTINKWRFFKLTNLTIFAALLRDIPMGCKDAVLPESLLRNPSIYCLTFERNTRQPYKDNLCLFRALALHLHGNERLEEET